MPESPQAVAYALLQRIAIAESWSASSDGDLNRPWRKSRQEILDTYKECLDAVLAQYRRWGPFP